MIAYARVASAIDGGARDDLVVRAIDNAHIPADPRNVDWQAYQDWLKAGNTPEEPTEAKPANEAA